MDCQIAFSVIKNVIMEQNKVLLKKLADEFQLDYDELTAKYLKPDYYLPVVSQETTKGKGKDKEVNKDQCK